MAITAVLAYFGIYISILFLYLGLAIPFLLLIFTPFLLVTSHLGKIYVCKYPQSPGFNENTDHHSIIILNSELDDNTLFCGISILIKVFLKIKCSFKIYNCYNVNDVKEVLKNKYATDIWIIGHGWRGGLGFKKKRSLNEKVFFLEK